MLQRQGDHRAIELWIAVRKKEGLGLLYESYVYAQYTGQPCNAFAVSMRDLLSAGINDCALKWLILAGYVVHVPRKRKPQRVKTQPLDLLPSCDDESRFALTEEGVAFIIDSIGPTNTISPGCDGRAVMVQSNAAVASVHWDAKHGMLYVNGVEVRHLRKDASKLRLIVDAFEKEGWPERVDIPLAALGGNDPKRQLRTLVSRLMNGMRQKVIEFHTCGDSGVRWTWVGDAKGGA